MHPGDTVIVISYANYEAAELEGFQPKVILVDADNRPVESFTEVAA